jgi:hypothetical protein
MQMASSFDLWGRATRHPLAASFTCSLILHLFLYGAYRAMPPALLAGQGRLARWLAAITISPKAEQKRLDAMKQLANQKLLEEIQRQLQAQEIPMTFVEVDPALASEPPKDSKYYSTHNTVAANPKPQADTKDPKIDGAETRMARLFTNPKPQPKPTPQPLQPAIPAKQQESPAPAPPAPATPPKEEKPPEVRPESKPDSKTEPAKPLEVLADRTLDKAEAQPDMKKPGGETIGELALAKPEKTEQVNREPGKGTPVAANPLITDPGPPPRHERPRTLAQAYQQNPMLTGKLMQQDGGVHRPGHISIDAKGSPFGAYDAAFIAAVQERWYQLLEKNTYMLDRRGKVVLDFRLRYDGRINAMTVNDNTVGDVLGLLCQRAVLDPAPYARWPGDMRRMVGGDYREVRFTFYYD